MYVSICMYTPRMWLTAIVQKRLINANFHVYSFIDHTTEYEQLLHTGKVLHTSSRKNTGH